MPEELILGEQRNAHEEGIADLKFPYSIVHQRYSFPDACPRLIDEVDKAVIIGPGLGESVGLINLIETYKQGYSRHG